MTTEVDHADTCGATYTRGPWVWSGLQLLAARVAPTGTGYSESVLITYGDAFEPTDEDKAIISAAPELVEALREAANEIDSLVEETIASVCVLDRHGYDRTTADESDRAEIERIEAIQAKIRAALSKALNTPVSGGSDGE